MAHADDIPRARNRQVILFAGVVILGLALLLVVRGARFSAAAVHVVFALGVFPMILAAMTWFTPVLTRRPSARGPVRVLPAAALIAGVLAIFGMVHWFTVVQVASAAGLAVALLFSLWTWRESRRAIGGAHPGLAWYQAAIGCLALGFVAVLASALIPEHWPALRRLHLHLNLFGFIGLTAVGTLPVLIPTAAGYQDATVNDRLRGDLKYAVAGTLLIAFGAAGYAPLAWVGLVAWLVPLVRLGAALRRHWTEIRGWHNAATVLSTAVLGFAAVLVAGALHGVIAPRTSLMLFFLLFLLPLVTGAVSHLFPLWLYPEAIPDFHARVRAIVTYSGAVRVALFFVGGVLLAAGFGWGLYLAIAALLYFLVQFTRALQT